MQVLHLNIDDPVSCIHYFGRLKGSLALSHYRISGYSYLSVYHKPLFEPNLTIYQPPEHELIIQFSLLHEYIDNRGISRQTYQLRAYDNYSGIQYMAFASEKNQTIADMYKEYLAYSYHKAGADLPDIYSTFDRSISPGVDGSEARKAQDKYLTQFIKLNPDLSDSTELLPIALAARILHAPKSENTDLLIYPVLLKIDYLKSVQSFNEINQYWDQLYDAGYCSKLLNRALVYLDEMASFFNRAGNSSFALKIYDSILQQPSCLRYAPQVVASVLLQRGWIYLRQKKFDQAFKDLTQVLKIEPENPEAYYRLAFLYQDLQQPEQAEESFSKAGELYKIQPDLISQCCYYKCKGEIYYYRRDYENALRNFRKMKDYARECNDLNLLYEATGFMANIYYHNRNYAQALAAYRENELTAERLGDANQLATVYFALGITCDELREHDQAYKYYKTSLCLAQRYANIDRIMEAHIAIGEFHLRNNDCKKATEEFKLALKIQQKHKIINSNAIMISGCLGQVCRKLKKYKKSAKHFKECIKLCSNINEQQNMINYKAQLAAIYKLSGQQNLALTQFKNILKSIDKNDYYLKIRAYISFYIAELYFQQTKFGKAEPFLSKAKLHFNSLYLQNPRPAYKEILNEIRQMELQIPLKS